MICSPSTRLVASSIRPMPSAWLDAHARAPHRYLRRPWSPTASYASGGNLKPTGRDGRPAESVFHKKRCALLKRIHGQLSYQELAFHLSRLRVVSRLCIGPASGARRSRSCKRRSARSLPGPGSGSILLLVQRQRDQGRCSSTGSLVRRHVHGAGRRRSARRRYIIAWQNQSTAPSGVPRPSKADQADGPDRRIDRLS